jgi:hypothetical protein
MEKARLEAYDAEQRLRLALYIYAFKWYDLACRLRLFENCFAGSEICLIHVAARDLGGGEYGE